MYIPKPWFIKELDFVVLSNTMFFDAQNNTCCEFYLTCLWSCLPLPSLLAPTFRLLQISDPDLPPRHPAQKARFRQTCKMSRPCTHESFGSLSHRKTKKDLSHYNSKITERAYLVIIKIPACRCLRGCNGTLEQWIFNQKVAVQMGALP